MRKLFSYVTILAITLFASASFAAAEKYILDPAHTYVFWQVNHFGFSHPSGKWMADGTLTIDQEKPEEGKLDVTIKVANIVTGIPKFDSHLKSADFFDVAKYPTATFKSTKITVTGKDTAEVTGDLTLHGVTKPVTLDVKLNKLDNSPITQKMTAGFSATTTIKRSDFGLDKFAPGVSDDAMVAIESEASKA